MGTESSCCRDARESVEDMKDHIDVNYRRIKGGTPPRGDSLKNLTLTSGYDPRLRQSK
jgi:hypothetical protein